MKDSHKATSAKCSHPREYGANHRFSRRTFLQGSAAVGGALTAPSLLVACEEEAKQQAERQTKPKRGGQLRVGLTGGGNTETLDPHKALSIADIARTETLYNRLTNYGPDGRVINELAQSFESNQDADVWTVNLKPDVVFHDGKPLTADDVIYSFRRILKNEFQGAIDIGMVDPKRVKRVDERTVRIGLKFPYVDFPDACAQRSIAIIPDGFDDFAKPNGTGAFKYQSFTVGQKSVFVRNPDYWENGKPYLDELVILSISDPGARMNGLRAGQLDAIESPELTQAKQLLNGNNPQIQLLNAESGAFTPITISVTTKPFDDPRVRTALRLIANREQLVDNALLGFGSLANDLFSPFDPNYYEGLPQRRQDLEQAKFLLKQAGQESLTFDLHSSRVAPGMLESAQLYSSQAEKSRVKVNVKHIPEDNYYTSVYLKVPVAQSGWASKSLPAQIRQSLNCDAPYNETDWCRPSFDELTRQAMSTKDEGKRRELYHELQRILYEEGGYLIWGFSNWVDAYGSNVHGFVPHVARNLSNWGFQDVWIS